MINWTALIVFVILFAFVTWIGFIAARWRRGDLTMLHEWGLGGRRFGTVVTWFLIGGDLYTAYTFIAVPALMFGAGAIGFFAVPYTIMVYPILYLVFPRLWSVAHKHGYITSADFVRGRFGNRWLALAIALTGILATMPYIALQLVGIQVVIGAMGIETSGFAGDLPRRDSGGGHQWPAPQPFSAGYCTANGNSTGSTSELAPTESKLQGPWPHSCNQRCSTFP